MLLEKMREEKRVREKKKRERERERDWENADTYKLSWLSMEGGRERFIIKELYTGPQIIGNETLCQVSDYLGLQQEKFNYILNL